MSITQFDLISLATTRLGGEAVSSYEDGTTEAQFAALIYPNALQSELSAYFWNFTLKTEQLALDVNTPVDRRWYFQYHRPSFILREIAVMDSSGSPVAYQIQGNRILTNHKPVWLKYHERKSEDQFPPYFQDLIVSRLAYDLALPLTGNLQTQLAMAREYAERKRIAYIVDAQSDDAISVVNETVSPYISGRW